MVIVPDDKKRVLESAPAEVVPDEKGHVLESAHTDASKADGVHVHLPEDGVPVPVPDAPGGTRPQRPELRHGGAGRGRGHALLPATAKVPGAQRQRP